MHHVAILIRAHHHPEIDMAANLRKRRGVVRSSITRLGDRVSELEETPDQPRTPDRARQLLTKLQTLDSDFRTVHLELIDLIDEANTDALDAEQERLDKLDDDVNLPHCKA